MLVRCARGVSWPDSQALALIMKSEVRLAHRCILDSLLTDV